MTGELSDNASVNLGILTFVVGVVAIVLIVSGYHDRKNAYEAATDQIRALMRAPAPPCPTPEKPEP